MASIQNYDEQLGDIWDDVNEQDESSEDDVSVDAEEKINYLFSELPTQLPYPLYTLCVIQIMTKLLHNIQTTTSHQLVIEGKDNIFYIINKICRHIKNNNKATITNFSYQSLRILQHLTGFVNLHAHIFKIVPIEHCDRLWIPNWVINSVDVHDQFLGQDFEIRECTNNLKNNSTHLINDQFVPITLVLIKWLYIIRRYFNKSKNVTELRIGWLGKIFSRVHLIIKRITYTIQNVNSLNTSLSLMIFISTSLTIPSVPRLFSNNLWYNNDFILTQELLSPFVSIKLLSLERSTLNESINDYNVISNHQIV